MNIGMFVLRAVVGFLFVGHGTQKLFGWFGGGGPNGTGQWFGSLGYRPARAMTYAAGVAEAGGGVLLFFGLLTPLACAVIIGVMVNTIGAVHAQNGPWNANGGYEYPLVLIASATAIASVGAGEFSLDAAIGLPLGGAYWGLLALCGGLLSGLIVLATRKTPAETAREERRAA